jgi:hypothetical protein
MPDVSFASDIKSLFRAVDISHMKRHHIKLDDHTFMSNPGQCWQSAWNTFIAR